MVGVVGPAGSGKTVYLGMLLDLLSRQADDLHVAEQEEEVVQLVRLPPQLTLVVAIGDAVDEVADVLPERPRTFTA